MPGRLVISAIALGFAASAQAQSLDQGRDIAVKSCSECHLVGRADATPKNFTAPAFADIGSMPSATLLSIKVFLRTPHANMPNIMLNESELDAIAEYIMSLKRN